MEAGLEPRPIPHAAAQARTDVAIVCAYFNPCHFRSRLANYRTFRDGLEKAGLRALTVELAFGDAAFELSSFRDVLQVRTDAANVMWQKERLLNIGIRHLAQQGAKKIAWLDADLLFENPLWCDELSRALDEHQVVQVFREIWRDESPEVGGFKPGAAHHYRRTGEITNEKALAGGGWAARTDLLSRVPLYEHAVVVGENDSLMYYAHFFHGDGKAHLLESRLFRRLNPALQEHFLRWAAPWGEAVRGQVGFVDQRARFLYHGSIRNRRYVDGAELYRAHDFDPDRDVDVGEDQCLAWTGSKSDFHRAVREYFLGRREDESPGESRCPSWEAP